MTKPKLVRLELHLTPETWRWLIKIARRAGHRSRAAAASALLEALIREDLEATIRKDLEAIQTAQRVQDRAQSTPWGEF